MRTAASAKEDRGRVDGAPDTGHMEALYKAIHCEIRRLYRLENAYSWLTAPQPLLNMRIPARMLAIGEGVTVLQLLRALDPSPTSHGVPARSRSARSVI